ncbi:MAG TPA: hypothetical protein VMB18_03010 [Terriglobales bacterium]|nr:hypothetical protein [Terriglobales bacterium]
MQKTCGAVLALVFSCALLTVQSQGQVAGQAAIGEVAMSHVPGDALAEPSPSFGNPLACSPAQKLQIPRSVAKRAKIKAQLMNVLRESIFDDAKGIVNLAREREIKDLVNRLTREKAE